MGFYLLDIVGAIPSVGSWMVANFALDHSNPKGVFLSIAVYDGWQNQLVLGTAALGFVLACLSLKGLNRRRASQLFGAISIGGAIVGNVAWFASGIGSNLPVRGTSGVTMAAIGLAFVPGLIGLAAVIVKDRNLTLLRGREKVRWRRKNWPVPYAGFWLMLVSVIVAYATLFTLTGNSVIHGVSLLCGILVATAYFMPKAKSLGLLNPSRLTANSADLNGPEP